MTGVQTCALPISFAFVHKTFEPVPFTKNGRSSVDSIISFPDIPQTVIYTKLSLSFMNVFFTSFNSVFPVITSLEYTLSPIFISFIGTNPFSVITSVFPVKQAGLFNF